MTRSTVRGAAAAIATTIVALVIGCGGGGGRDNPERPTIDVEVVSQLVDVGQRFELDASGSFDPTNRGLSYFWTLVPPENSQAEIEDHCEENPDEVCTQNFNACEKDTTDLCTTDVDCKTAGCVDDCEECKGTCASDETQTCTLDAECQSTGCTDTCDECREGFADSSPQCTTGRCQVDQGRSNDFATFVADVPGPYTVRVLVQTNEANDTGTVELDTYPSLYLLGSLFEFGGTLGGLVGEFADAETFAEGAVAMITSPETGNLLLAIPGPPGRIREFNYRDGTDLGQFGETGDFVTTPVAMAFDNNDRILIADADGTVSSFDATEGRFVRTVGDVAASGEEVAAIAISPLTNDLLVVDGRAGQPVRKYNASTGAANGTFGDIGTTAGQAIDVAFLGSAVFVADQSGQLVTCTDAENGTGCSLVAAAAGPGLLQAGGPTSIAVNPAADASDADVLVADTVTKAVIGCKSDGSSCAVFGGTSGLDSDYLDLAFAPAEVPTPEPPPQFTTTTTSTTIPEP